MFSPLGFQSLRCSVFRCSFFRCLVSTLKFVTDSDLRYHKGTLHAKKKKFVKCKIGSKVVQRYSYTDHKLIHSTERDVKCSLCYATLRGPANLKNHGKSVHKSRSDIPYLNKGPYKRIYSTLY